MDEKQAVSVTGGWLGTYRYRGLEYPRGPVRFEATFKSDATTGSFSGAVLDEGPPGESNVTGTQTGSQIRFTKTYTKIGGLLSTRVAEYEGSLSEDGQVISGHWKAVSRIFGVRAHGDWEAHRTWSAHHETTVRREESASS